MKTKSRSLFFPTMAGFLFGYYFQDLKAAMSPDWLVYLLCFFVYAFIYFAYNFYYRIKANYACS